MTKQKQEKQKEAKCKFDRIEVQLGAHGRTNVIDPSKCAIVVEPKLIYLGSGYKIAWKKVTSFKMMENDEGFELESEKHFAFVFGPAPKDWPDCRKLLQKYWQRQLNIRARKSEEQKQQEEEERRAKRSYSSRKSYSSKSYKSMTAKFLARNENRNNWDSSDDEETFNVQRPKRKPLDDEEEQEHPTADTAAEGDDVMVEENQEQAMEDAAADADLAERQEQEQNDQDEMQDQDSEEEEVSIPKRKKLKRKRVHQEDDDSDDELFGAEMTTPNPQSRTVSPHTIARKRFEDDEDDDEDENDAPKEKKVVTKKTKVITPPVADYFLPKKKTKTATKDEQEAPAPPSVKRKTSTSNFFAPKRAAKVASPVDDPLEEDPLDDSQSTVVPSQTSTVVASPVSTSLATDEMDMGSSSSTPKRKIEFSESSSTSKTIDEEDPLVESPQQSPRRSPVRIKRHPRRKMMLNNKRTYGSSQKDRASRALEMADANQSPKRRNLTLALSPSRNRYKRDYDFGGSPTRSPNRSPLATSNNSPSRLPMPDFRGIKNIGNTCYMNASLQMLFSVPSFLKQLALGTIPEHSVVSSIVELFQELQLVKRAPASARNLKMAVDDKTNKFRGYQQRDANEFLGDLLDTMHEELVDAEKEGKEEEKKKEKEEPPAETKSTHPTDNFFRMDVEVCLKCKSCGYTRTKEEMYRYLSLDILQKEGEEQNTRPNVEECLEAFFQPEDREIKCEKCKEGLVAEQTMKVLSRPKAILLHLKRFAMVELPRKDDESSPNFVLRKNKAPVELDKSLSLNPFLKAAADDDDNTRAVATNKQEYKIQSIVHHIGSSADSGHYTADALREDPKDSKKSKTWVSFDDTLVERVSEADVLEDKPRWKTAYMMLYSLVDP